MRCEDLGTLQERQLQQQGGVFPDFRDVEVRLAAKGKVAAKKLAQEIETEIAIRRGSEDVFDALFELVARS